MSESIYDIARDLIKFNEKTLNDLARLLAQEGDWVDAPGPPPTTHREWVDFMIPWWREEEYPDEDVPAMWDKHCPTMGDDECRMHAARYHRETPSHGEAIGVTIRAWSLWVNSPEDAAIREALSFHIHEALSRGIDH